MERRTKSHLTFIASLKSAIHLDALSLRLSTHSTTRAERLKHNKRLHNARFINHTARTMEQHQIFLISALLRLLPYSMFNMFLVYVFPPFPHKLHTQPLRRCLRFAFENKFHPVAWEEENVWLWGVIVVFCAEILSCG